MAFYMIRQAKRTTKSPILQPRFAYTRDMSTVETKTLKDAIYARLLYFMRKQNITQYKLAQISNLPISTVKNILQRRTKSINLKTVIMLSNGLGITPSEFLDYPSFLAQNIELE